MSIEIRPLRTGDPDDLAAMIRNDLRAFASDMDPEPVAGRFALGMEAERFLVADDAGLVVGNAGAFSMELTVAPGLAVPVAGVTWVAVSPSHRRRGIMRRVVESLHDDARRRGEAAAVLYASESSIYDNVGYGWATVQQPVLLHSRELRFRDSAPGPEGVRFVEVEQIKTIGPVLHDAWRLGRVGAVSDPERRWQARSDLEGSPGSYAVVHHDEAGDVDGYALYQVVEKWHDGFPSHELFVVDLIALGPVAHGALWRFLCSMDLVGEVRCNDVPPDDPLPWLLRNPRAVRTTNRTDGLWIRLLDVAQFFSARLRDVEPSVTIEVAGDEAAVSGTWELGAGGCRRTDAPVEVALGISELGSLSLGGHSAVVLAVAGRVEERAEGAAARLDGVLRAPHVPHCPTHF